jgi:N-acetylglucosaminyldiphosphoundecaprenol N-acetyl-beta-D-mannosaminyltransferase
MLMPPPKLPLLGVGVSVTSYGEVLRTCWSWIEHRRAWVESGSPEAMSPTGRYTALLTVHSVMNGVLDGVVRSALNNADIAATDGMPLVWALRSLGARAQQRVYGPDLMLAICGQAARVGHRVFLYGGRSETLAILVGRLKSRFPTLEIAGAYAPPFRPLTAEEDRACVASILESQADVLFVGVGAPKQERWMAEHCTSLPGVVMFGVGAAFDFHAGRVRQAPPWMQRSGLEWLFRLGVEPARLWRRYVLLNPLFLMMWALQSAGLINYNLEPTGSRTDRVNE